MMAPILASQSGRLPSRVPASTPSGTPISMARIVLATASSAVAGSLVSRSAVTGLPVV